MSTSRKEKYVAIVPVYSSGEIRVFGPWASLARALDFRDKVNARLDAIEKRRGMEAAHPSMRYGRAQLRLIVWPTIAEATKTATDGIER